MKAKTVPRTLTLASSPKASSPGTWMAPTRPCTSTVATGRLKAREASVARTTAASAPGTAGTRFGMRFQSVMTAMVPAPIASEARAWVLPAASASAPGSPASLPRPEAGASMPAAA